MKTKTRKMSRAVARKKFTAALAQLQKAELVRAHEAKGNEYIFKHALVQDTAQSTLLHGEYRRLNLLVAQAYEKMFPAQTMKEYAAILAQHYDAAGDDAKTLQYAMRAGDLAARIYANTEAIEFYTHATDHALKLGATHTQLRELFSKRGRAYELMGNFDAALENYAEMEQVAQTRGDRALELAALLARATIHALPNAKFSAERAQALSEQSLALARVLNDRAAQAKIFWNLELLAHFTGKPTEAIAYGEQAIALARELNLREQLAYALNDTGRVYFTKRQFAEGMQVLREAQTLWRELDNKPMLADNLNTLATSLGSAGQVAEGLALADEAYQLGREIHNPWTMAHSCMTRSFIHVERGEWAAALALMQECLELAARAGFQIGLASARMMSALVYVDLGDLTRALEMVSSQANQTNSMWQANSYGVLAQVYIAQGALAEAREAIRAGNATRGGEPPNPFVGSTVLLAEAQLAFAEKDYARAIAILNEKIERITASTIRPIQIAVLLLKAQALEKQGALENALRVAQEARAQAGQFQSRRLLWQIHALLGEIATQRGEDAQAAENYMRAREILEYIAAHVPDEYREAFLNTAPVRHVLQQSI